MTNRRYRLVVHGRVRGVLYRVTARDMAKGLGLSGSAINTGPNEVIVEIEGDLGKIEKFVDWAHEGSPHAHVQSVEISEIRPLNQRGFSIG